MITALAKFLCLSPNSSLVDLYASTEVLDQMGEDASDVTLSSSDSTSPNISPLKKRRLDVYRHSSVPLAYQPLMTEIHPLLIQECDLAREWWWTEVHEHVCSGGEQQVDEQRQRARSVMLDYLVRGLVSMGATTEALSAGFAYVDYLFFGHGAKQWTPWSRMQTATFAIVVLASKTEDSHTDCDMQYYIEQLMTPSCHNGKTLAHALDYEVRLLKTLGHRAFLVGPLYYLELWSVRHVPVSIGATSKLILGTIVHSYRLMTRYSPLLVAYACLTLATYVHRHTHAVRYAINPRFMECDVLVNEAQHVARVQDIVNPSAIRALVPEIVEWLEPLHYYFAHGQWASHVHEFERVVYTSAIQAPVVVDDQGTLCTANYYGKPLASVLKELLSLRRDYSLLEYQVPQLTPV